MELLANELRTAWATGYELLTIGLRAQGLQAQERWGEAVAG